MIQIVTQKSWTCKPHYTISCHDTCTILHITWRSTQFVILNLAAAAGRAALAHLNGAMQLAFAKIFA